MAGTMMDFNSPMMRARDAFLRFLADSEIDNNGDPERGNFWVCNSSKGLQLDALAAALGYRGGMKEAMIAAEVWEPDPPTEY